MAAISEVATTTGKTAEWENSQSLKKIRTIKGNILAEDGLAARDIIIDSWQILKKV